MKDKFILTAPVDYFSPVSAKEIVEKLESNTDSGLSNEEAALRIREFGKNTIESKKHKHFLVELLSHFKSPLVLILTVAAIISYSLGETINASIILFIIIVSIAIDFYQERDARNAAEKLKHVKSKAQIVRDNV